MVVQSLRSVESETQSTTVWQASPSFIISQSLLKLMLTESVILSNYIIHCCPLLLLSSIFRITSLFEWIDSSHQAKVLDHQPFNRYSGLIPLGLTSSISLLRESQEFSLAPQFKTINSLVLSLLDSSTLILMHDYWKNHTFWLCEFLSANWSLCFLICCLGVP